jgi:hypothetical protein
MGHLGYAQQVFEPAHTIAAEAAPEKVEKKAPVIQIADGEKSILGPFRLR